MNVTEWEIPAADRLALSGRSPSQTYFTLNEPMPSSAAACMS